jgi:glycosyltransferase involved in cell wall biosynthesis
MSEAGAIGAKISVCLLTYNHAQLIESTLRSILDQTVGGYEIVVSDDCSTDGTWDRILALAEEHGGVKPIRTPRNLGMAANANFAVAQTSRQYVALLHHDDLCRRDLLEKWVGVLERHADVVFVFNHYGRHGRVEMYTVPIEVERMEGRVFCDTYLLPSWGCPIHGTAMIRRAAWERVGGMRERFGLLADVDLWMRLARIGAVGYVPEAVIEIRQDRPSYYPDIYKAEQWSWERQRILYEIHATNRLETLDFDSPRDRLRWLRFRWRLTRETLHWLAYAVVKRKGGLLTTSDRGATPWDLPGLDLLRRLLRRAAPAGGAIREDA